MIIHLPLNMSEEAVKNLAEKNKAMWFRDKTQYVLVTSSSIHEIPPSLQAMATGHWDTGSDIQLASRKYHPETRTIDFGGVMIGGQTQNTVMIAGPCSVESETQLDQCAKICKGLNIQLLRGGCFKPRTSPYSFQGLGSEGLALLNVMKKRYGLKVITEVRDATQVDEVIEATDIVQIGAKAMYDQGILRRCSEINKPILLKRGFGSTLQEFVQAAEFILSGGNLQVALCERGIRTFENKTRFTLDLCGVAWLKQHINLPVILDPSHAMGYFYGVPDLTRACVAMGVDGLLIEMHPDPASAKSDASQQLDFPTFTTLYDSLTPVAKAVGRTIV